MIEGSKQQPMKTPTAVVPTSSRPVSNVVPGSTDHSADPSARDDDQQQPLLAPQPVGELPAAP